MPTDPSELAFHCEGQALIAPSLECTFYFEHASTGAVADFAHQALDALEGDLTHYHTLQMRRFGKRGKRSETAWDKLFADPRPGGFQWMMLRGDGAPDGVSSAELEVSFRPRPAPPVTGTERARQAEENREHFEVRMAVGTRPITHVRAAFPLGHRLAEPEALLPWLRGLRCVTNPCFVTGHAGYAIELHTEVGGRERYRQLQERALDPSRTWLGAPRRRHKDTPEILAWQARVPAQDQARAVADLRSGSRSRRMLRRPGCGRTRACQSTGRGLPRSRKRSHDPGRTFPGPRRGGDRTARIRSRGPRSLSR